MAIVTPEKVYRRCLNDRWAVGGFIGYNLEIMEAAVKAAVDVKAPIMVQASCRVIDYAGADVLYAMAKAYSKRYHTDLILHLDHQGHRLPPGIVRKGSDVIFIFIKRAAA